MFIDPLDPSCEKMIDPASRYTDLLVPIIRAGEITYAFPPLTEIRQYAMSELNQLSCPMRRFLNPEPYSVGLEKSLLAMKLEMIRKLKKK